MSRHVDDADCSEAIQHERSKAEVNGDSASLFLREAVRVDSRERAHE
jgi:hypothetical protein